METYVRGGTGTKSGGVNREDRLWDGKRKEEKISGGKALKEEDTEICGLDTRKKTGKKGKCRQSTIKSALAGAEV